MSPPQCLQERSWLFPGSSAPLPSWARGTQGLLGPPLLPHHEGRDVFPNPCVIQAALYLGPAQRQTLTGISLFQACLHTSLSIKASKGAAELQRQLFPVSVADIVLLQHEAGAPRVGFVTFGAAQSTQSTAAPVAEGLGKAQSQGESFCQPRFKLLKKNSSYNPCKKNLFIW